MKQTKTKTLDRSVVYMYVCMYRMNPVPNHLYKESSSL